MQNTFIENLVTIKQDLSEATFMVKHKSINMYYLAREKFTGLNGNANPEAFDQAVTVFVNKYIYTFVGTIIFFASVMAGLGIAFAEFSQDPNRELHRSKRKILFAMIGCGIALGANVIVAIFATIMRAAGSA